MKETANTPTADKPPVRISVVVPVYNAAAYIGECVESIRRQTFGDWELILSDDGSTDGSLSLCRSLAETINRTSAKGHRVKVLSGPNAGVSAARNRGVAAAKGEFILFCDADDTYSPTAAATLWQLAETYPSADIAVGDFVNTRHNPFGPATGKTRSTPPSCRTWCEPPETAVIRTLYQRRPHHPSVCAKLIRRRLLVENPMREDMRYEDLELTPRLYLSARSVAFTTATVYFYRLNPQSYIHTWQDGRTDALKAVDLIRTYLTDYVSRTYGTPGRQMDADGDGFADTDAPIADALVRATRSRRFSAYFNLYNLARRYDRPDLARDCMREIRQMARLVLTDRHARFKNRLAALWVVISHPGHPDKSA